MKKRKKQEIFSSIVYILLLVIAFASFLFLGIRLSGYAIEQKLSTTSGIIIDPGIHVIYDTFSGVTNDFLRMTDSQLASISSLKLEKLFGRIDFNGTVNLANDAVNNEINLDNNVDIHFREIVINTNVLPSLSKPSRVYMKGISFASPIVFINDNYCPTCNIVSFSNSLLVVDVPAFSKLDVYNNPYCGDNICQPFNRESCATCPQDCGYCDKPDVPPGTGGSTPDLSAGTGTTSSTAGQTSGGQILGTLTEQIQESFFSMDKNLIKVNLVQGEAKKETFKVTNDGKNNINILLTSDLSGKLLNVSNSSFSLKHGETKEIEVYFYSKEDQNPDVYLSKITVESAGKYKDIIVIVEVKQKNPLFDIKTHINKKQVYPGDMLTTTTDITNMGELKNVDVTLYYGIKNFDNEVLYFRQESLAIKDRLNVVREVDVPEYIPAGDYVFYAKVSYGNISASAVDQLRVLKIENPWIKLNNQTLGILVAIILILIVLFIIWRIKYSKFR